MFEVVDLWGLAFSDDGHSVFASVSTGAQAFSFLNSQLSGTVS